MAQLVFHLMVLLVMLFGLAVMTTLIRFRPVQRFFLVTFLVLLALWIALPWLASLLAALPGFSLPSFGGGWANLVASLRAWTWWYLLACGGATAVFVGGLAIEARG